MAILKFVKDPQAVLDYKLDFAPKTSGVISNGVDYLGVGETITNVSITIDKVTASPLLINNYSITDSGTSVTAWLSGGLLKSSYLVTVHITTSIGRQDDRSFRVVVKDL